MARTKSFSSYINAINQDVNLAKGKSDITSVSAGAITGSTFSEDIVLFGSSIKSYDYVGGESGWRIDGTGVAEFADVYVRGDINAQTGTIGYWNISSPGVVRRIGSSTQFGTFLESEDVGPNDDSKTSGVYVGLFKSYFEDPVPLINRRRVSNVATITIQDNQFVAGDRVVVDVVEDSTYNNGGLPVTVISATGDSISYINTGSDYPASGSETTTDTTSTGTVTFYNPDIAGLYIKDYGKADIDYGYFSSAGLAFVSGSRVNLVHNPSFEFVKSVSVTNISGSGTTVTYTASNNFIAGETVTIEGADTSAYNLTDATIATANSTAFTVTNSATGTGSNAVAYSRVSNAASWNYVAASTNPVDLVQFSTLTNTYLASSTHGGYASWSNTMSTSYSLDGVIEYSKGLTYNLFSNERTLVLGYDSFLDYKPFEAAPSSVTANSTTIVFTTTGAHGLSTGDLVYLDFVTTGDSGLYGPGEWVLSDGTYSVTAAPSNTTFRIANPDSGNTLTSAGTFTGVDGRTAKLYHAIYPAVPLSSINFKFSNSTSTSISNVVSDITTSSWVTNNNKYLYQPVADWFSQFLNLTHGVKPLKSYSGNPIYIDAEKLRLEYARLDSTGFDAESNITLSLPAAVYDQALTGNFTTSNIAYMTSTVSATAISGNGTTVTVTATNNFSAGDLVTITGASTSAYNGIVNLPVVTASASSFTVSSSATGATSTCTATARRVVSQIIDSVSLSTEPVGFYGDTSSDYSWETSSLNTPAQISIQNPKKWIDVDLSTQSGYVSNLDYLGFKQSRLSIPMLSQPLIESDSDYSSDIAAYFDYTSEYENLKTSSGVVSVLGVDGSTYYNYESRTNLATSKIKSAGQLIASLERSDNSSFFASATVSVDVNGSALFNVTADTASFSNRVLANTSTDTFTSADATGTGIWLDGEAGRGYIAVSRSLGIPLYIKRTGDAGVLVSLNSMGTQQGSISVAGTTVSYNTFLGSHYSELDEPTPLKGTIMESINELVEQRYASQERMPKAKTSDSVGSSKVYGVYLGTDRDEEDRERGHLIAAIGAGWVRIASGVTVQAGDLIESNGDGCGRVQSDDVIRASTVGKITSNVVVDTYPDGSYIVPCVLYCG